MAGGDLEREEDGDLDELGSRLRRGAGDLDGEREGDLPRPLALCPPRPRGM